MHWPQGEVLVKHSWRSTVGQQHPGVQINTGKKEKKGVEVEGTTVKGGREVILKWEQKSKKYLQLLIQQPLVLRPL